MDNEYKISNPKNQLIVIFISLLILIGFLTLNVPAEEAEEERTIILNDIVPTSKVWKIRTDENGTENITGLMKYIDMNYTQLNETDWRFCGSPNKTALKELNDCKDKICKEKIAKELKATKEKVDEYRAKLKEVPVKKVKGNLHISTDKIDITKDEFCFDVAVPEWDRYKSFSIGFDTVVFDTDEECNVTGSIGYENEIVVANCELHVKSGGVLTMSNTSFQSNGTSNQYDHTVEAGGIWILENSSEIIDAGGTGNNFYLSVYGTMEVNDLKTLCNDITRWYSRGSTSELIVSNLTMPYGDLLSWYVSSTGNITCNLPYVTWSGAQQDTYNKVSPPGFLRGYMDYDFYFAPTFQYTDALMGRCYPINVTDGETPQSGNTITILNGSDTSGTCVTDANGQCDLCVILGAYDYAEGKTIEVDGINKSIVFYDNDTLTDIIITIGAADSTPPTIYLEQPANNTINTTATPGFIFNVTDDIATTLSCDLNINGSGNVTDASVSNGTSTEITAPTLTNGDYWWNITCSDGTNTNTSETRNISISMYTEFSGCMELDTTDHEYRLTANITNSGFDKCINITASYITFDCQGYTIDGTDTAGTIGINVAEDNTTVKNCLLSDWNYAIDIPAAGSNSSITDVVIESSSQGVATGGGTHFVMIDNLTTNDSCGYSVIFYDTNNTLQNSKINATYYGVSFTGTSGNLVNNTEFGIINRLPIITRPDTTADCDNIVESSTDINGRAIFYHHTTAVTLEHWDNNASQIILCNADNSTINNITLNPPVKSGGIDIVATTGVTISNIDLDNTFWPILLDYHSVNNVITNFTLKSSTDGIRISRSNNSMIQHGWIENMTTYGVYISDGSTANQFYNVTINSSGGDNIRVYRGDNTTFSNMTVRETTAKGFALIETNYTVINNSKIILNDDGIYLDKTTNSTFYNNLINATNNNVVFNTESEGNNWNTTNQTGTRVYSSGTNIGGNYWDNSTGGYSVTCTDSDSDGFCDSPLNITNMEICTIGVDCGNNVDFLPYNADSTLPTIYLEQPANNTINTTATPGFIFNVTDDQAATLDCNLIINDTEYGNDASVSNATSTEITANASLSNGDYIWQINCSDGTNTNLSDGRNISISVSAAVDLCKPNATGFFTVNQTCVYLDNTTNIDAGLIVQDNGVINLTNAVLNFTTQRIEIKPGGAIFFDTNSNPFSKS